jgi:hypothetical protein
MRLPECLLELAAVLLVGVSPLEGAAACTLFVHWASTASLAFSVRIRFRGPVTDSVGASRGMAHNERREFDKICVLKLTKTKSPI